MTIPQEDKKQLKKFEEIEEKYLDKVEPLFDDYLDVLNLIVISNLTLRKKKKRIKEAQKKLFKQIEKISTSFTQDVIKNSEKVAKALLKSIGSKDVQKLSKTKIKEITDSYIEEVELNLKAIATKYKNKADKVAIQKKREVIREESLKFKDGIERQATSQRNKRLVKINELKTKTGGTIKLRNSLRLGMGDVGFRADTDILESVWILNQITQVIHISVIDHKTTSICRSLDQTIRRLGVDQLPPMHPNCRSEIYPLTI